MSNERAEFIFLDELRDTGVVNMYGAAPYLQDAFGLNHKEARQVLREWMESFKETSNATH